MNSMFKAENYDRGKTQGKVNISVEFSEMSPPKGYAGTLEGVSRGPGPRLEWHVEVPPGTVRLQCGCGALQQQVLYTCVVDASDHKQRQI